MSGHEDRNNIFEQPVLVVDDNTDIASIVSMILKKVGFKNIRKAASVAEAKKVILNQADEQAKRLALVITDLELGDGTGLEIVTLIRQSCPETKIIMMTGCADEKLLDIVRQANIDSLLCKPNILFPLRQTLEKFFTQPVTTTATAC
jgi:two-component system response regulator PilR (NtrC family)